MIGAPGLKTLRQGHDVRRGHPERLDRRPELRAPGASPTTSSASGRWPSGWSSTRWSGSARRCGQLDIGGLPPQVAAGSTVSGRTVPPEPPRRQAREVFGLELLGPTRCCPSTRRAASRLRSGATTRALTGAADVGRRDRRCYASRTRAQRVLPRRRDLGGRPAAWTERQPRQREIPLPRGLVTR